MSTSTRFNLLIKFLSVKMKSQNEAFWCLFFTKKVSAVIYTEGGLTTLPMVK